MSEPERTGDQGKAATESADEQIARLERLLREEQAARQKRERTLLLDIISIIDGLARLEQVIEREELDEKPARLFERYQLARRKAENMLHREGVQKINSLGQPMNPELHHVLDVRDEAEAEPDTIVEVEEDGYLYEGEVLRPATVIVASGASSGTVPASSEDPEQTEEE